VFFDWLPRQSNLLRRIGLNSSGKPSAVFLPRTDRYRAGVETHDRSLDRESERNILKTGTAYAAQMEWQDSAENSQNETSPNERSGEIDVP